MHPSLAWQLVGRTAALSQLVLARGQARSAGGAQDLKPGVVAGRTGWGRADAATRRPALLDGDRAAGLAMFLEVTLVVLLGSVKGRRRGDLRDDLPPYRLLLGVA